MPQPETNVGNRKTFRCHIKYIPTHIYTANMQNIFWILFNVTIFPKWKFILLIQDEGKQVCTYKT